MPVVVAIGLLLGSLYGIAVLAKGAAAEIVDWDPVWLGGPEPWGIKIYRNLSGSRTAWRVEVLHRGVFCTDKEWRGRNARHVTANYVQLWAERWLLEHPTGCP